jgi:hypothetical protein
MMPLITLIIFQFTPYVINCVNYIIINVFSLLIFLLLFILNYIYFFFDKSKYIKKAQKGRNP